ncbi:MAG: hypothetical protein VB050_12290 [Geobacteraceae bacterium]|nr:hypothetical protein [Geobacteraceae bacterium]
MDRKNLDDFEILFTEAIQELYLTREIRHESGEFGNGYILYHNNVLVFRLVSDKSMLFIEVGVKAEPSELFDLSLIVNYVNNLDLLHKNTIADQVKFLCINSKTITDMFKTKYKETTKVLQQLQKERAVRSIDKLQTGDVQEYWKTGKIDKFS